MVFILGNPKTNFYSVYFNIRSTWRSQSKLSVILVYLCMEKGLVCDFCLRWRNFRLESVRYFVPKTIVAFETVVGTATALCKNGSSWLGTDGICSLIAGWDTSSRYSAYDAELSSNQPYHSFHLPSPRVMASNNSQCKFQIFVSMEGNLLVYNYGFSSCFSPAKVVVIRQIDCGAAFVLRSERTISSCSDTVDLW